MKQGFFVFISLVLMVLFCVPVFGQVNSKSVETFSIDNFDTAGEMEWTWDVQASRLVADGYPVLGYVKGMPNSLKNLQKEGDPEPMVLGAKVSFNRKGDNWMEIYPTKAGEDGEVKNYEVPLQGIVSHFDLWVWGANYTYYVELLVRDALGSVHVIPVCTTNFEGWKNFTIKVPSTIPQRSSLRSGPETLAFVGIRVRSDFNEYVDDYVVYFDNLKYTTSILENIYDGYELRYADFGGEATDSTESTGAPEGVQTVEGEK